MTGASLSDLMAATGLQKGGIYRHFSSKEELAAEAFDYTWEAAWNARLLHLDEKANGIDKLKQLIANFIDHRSPVPGGCPVLNTAIDADDGNPVLRSHAAKALRSWLSRLRAIVELAREQGETRPELIPKAVASVIVASLEGRPDDEPPAAERRAASDRPVAPEQVSGKRGRCRMMTEDHQAHEDDARLYLDDLQVGQRFTSGTYVIEEARIKSFAAEFDPQPFHLDESAAQASIFKGLAASGWHTAAVAMRLLVDGGLPFAHGLVGLGGEVAWPRPTRPGDTSAGRKRNCGNQAFALQTTARDRHGSKYDA